MRPGPVKRAVPAMTSTPWRRSESDESSGSIVRCAPCTCSITRAKSISGSLGVSPTDCALRIRCASSAAAMSALLGTHPVHRQSPPGPRVSRSTSTTRAPSPAAVRDATRPAVPPPMTTRSYGFSVVWRAMRENLTEGERWSRDLLDRLRAERFTPGAWRRFFGDGFQRARVTRGRRPELVAQSRAWGRVGLVAALPFGPRVAASWALWWAMVDWHLGMVETAAGRERQLVAADALTLARLWAAPIVRRHPEPWLVATAMATALAGGLRAPPAGPTRLGRDFDSTADTVFLDAALRGAAERHGLDPRLLELE